MAQRTKKTATVADWKEGIEFGDMADLIQVVDIRTATEPTQTYAGGGRIIADSVSNGGPASGVELRVGDLYPAPRGGDWVRFERDDDLDDAEDLTVWFQTYSAEEPLPVIGNRTTVNPPGIELPDIFPIRQIAASEAEIVEWQGTVDTSGTSIITPPSGPAGVEDIIAVVQHVSINFKAQNESPPYTGEVRMTMGTDLGLTGSRAYFQKTAVAVAYANNVSSVPMAPDLGAFFRQRNDSVMKIECTETVDNTQDVRAQIIYVL